MKSRIKWTKEKLIRFEEAVAEEFKAGKINAPVHLCGGNEEQLINLFSSIRKRDWVVSSHRNHYHYLLKGGDPSELMSEIRGETDGICHGAARSMHVIDVKKKFISTGIVAGGCGIAVGLALGLKKRKLKDSHVWCFCGDGAEDSGHYIEAVRFGLSRKLPLTFIIEDNDYAVDSTKKMRWHNWTMFNSPNVIRYSYIRKYPHVGIGEHVSM